MTLDYQTIQYLEVVGDAVHIHYTDGKTVSALSNGSGRFMPRKAGAGTPPENYEPWTPPTDPPTPGSWSHPLAGSVITSLFGMRAGGMHYGVDMSTTRNAVGGPVRSVTDMVITRAHDAYEGGNATGGTYVKGHTPDGAYTFCYYHGADETLAVSVGQVVTPGTLLFMEGGTGNATGTHLHFEIIKGNWPDPWAPPYSNGAQFLDPLPVLRANGVNI